MHACLLACLLYSWAGCCETQAAQGGVHHEELSTCKLAEATG